MDRCIYFFVSISCNFILVQEIHPAESTDLFWASHWLLGQSKSYYQISNNAELFLASDIFLSWIVIWRRATFTWMRNAMLGFHLFTKHGFTYVTVDGHVNISKEKNRHWYISCIFESRIHSDWIKCTTTRMVSAFVLNIYRSIRWPHFMHW